jgi:hypothetical protein
MVFSREKAGRRALSSRGAATDCSPTRERGVYRHVNCQLRRSVRFRRQILRPCRGWNSKQTISTGLRPWLQSVAAPRLRRLIPRTLTFSRQFHKFAIHPAENFFEVTFVGSIKRQQRPARHAGVEAFERHRDF